MKKILPFLVLFFTLNLFSQKEANFWYFGNKAALDFNSGTPLPVSNSELNTTEGCSSFSDIDGNLLFYIGASSPAGRNLTVWGKDNQPMPNGVGLEGDSSSSQSALTIPAPNNPNIYYVFTVGANSSGNAGFWYYTIDMTANGGLGDVIDGPVVLGVAANHNRWTEKVTAVRADDCNSFWVISISQRTSSSNNNQFYAYKVTNTGVDLTNPVISEINGFLTDDVRGYLKVSPDGKKLVAANMGAGTFLFDFNDVTGTVTNYNNSGTTNRLDLDGREGYGVEFSNSSDRLYISTGSFNGAQEHLYQFDLTQPTFNEINNNRYKVYDYFNTRGALQLGPNGKIYWSSDNSNAISVINKPDALGAAVNYEHQTVSLGAGTTATQGLPPFISSLFSSIDIKDSDTNETINNQDLKFCVGENKVIVPDPVTGATTPSYKWEFDNGTTTTVIATVPNLTLNNLQKTDNGKYTLTIELTDNCGNITQYVGTCNIDVYEAASAKANPEPIKECDTDLTIPNSFDLEVKDTEILAGLDAAIFDVLYFDSLAAANANATNTSLPNPYIVNTVSSQTIYARVQNKNAPNSCAAITSFELEVTSEPKPTQPSDYLVCDDTISGSDTDGISNNFILSNKDSEILDSLSNTQYRVSYHTDITDAQTSSTTNNIDKNSNYTVTNSERIFVRVENIDNTDCNAVSNDNDGSLFTSFLLVVNPLPVIKNPNPAQIRQCVNSIDGKATINLTIAENNISDNPNGTFKYFEDAAATIEILNYTAYPVDANTNPPATVWVQTISEFGCVRISELELIIGTAADEAYNETFVECDDFLDADGNNTASNSDIDGITWFNLDTTTITSAINTNPNISVFFYEEIDDRDQSKNEIDIANYRNTNKPNTTGNPFPIYYKLVNNINNDCTGIGEINLQVKSVPLANTIANYNLCDDALSGNTTDGKNANLNLRDKELDILGSTQSNTDYEVSFHTSQTGAENKTDLIINDTNYTNTTPAGFSVGDISEQTIFIRVENKNTGCINAQSNFKIIVNPIPAVTKTITPLAVCDNDVDPRNRSTENIDLTSKSLEILDGKTNHRVAYYVTLQDANDGTEITDPSNFQNTTTLTTFPADFNTDDPGIQTIFFKIIDETGNNCESLFATFQLLIYPEPNLPINISEYTDCDNTTDSFDDDDNGINADISLKNKIPEILTNYPVSEYDDFKVSFYTTLIDANTGAISNAIDEDSYQNTSNNQTIYVRVENIKNTPVACVNSKLSFNINIKPLPNFTVQGEKDIDLPQIICLNAPNLVLIAENPSANYLYEWTDAAGTTLGNNQTLAITTPGNYTITASDNFPNGCKRERTIVVKASNIATLERDYVTIIDQSNNIAANTLSSVRIDTITNNLGPGNYQFALLNNDNNNRIPSSGFQDDPIFEDIEGGIYTIIVNDKKGCVQDTTLQISVIQFPQFFTPNNDGVNDTWHVKGANTTFYPNSSIHIFNRFGKLVAQIQIDGNGWDGTSKNKPLPSDDYWFTVQLIPADTSKEVILKRGHLSLIRK
ncbi:T9SS type B sorting domain-containing protein [uncultured Polaribacter sp.]|uniref:T9SS type B sorting domain-containing protein n=1 Tax=uncultured Polaribacter sp. TaxID=174711 RepID=UPI002617D0FD|nr:T9SS type B sorting domain-containing protein [uncultured Polaribacter sp.]